MDATPDTNPSASSDPVFGFVLFGGPLSGALVRDLRLANELARRGYRVHLWWAMDRSRETYIEPGITEHWLMHGYRYYPSVLGGWRTRGVRDRLGQAITAMTGDMRRSHFLQKRPHVLSKTVHGLIRAVGDGIQRDRPLIDRFARQLDEAQVTHVLPMLAVLCPFVDAARQRTRRAIELLVTFQGYELYLNYAREIDYEKTMHRLFRRMVERSQRPAIAVSEDYKQRVVEDIAVPAESITAIPPGVEIPEPVDRNAARQQVATGLGDRGFRPDLPLVTYIGRQDSEKGIDLLLYAAAILKRRGLDLQLVIAGPTLFDSRYGEVCRQIARNLRLPAIFQRQVTHAYRRQLVAASACVVYPSIHREPFGMVAAEAAALGTPTVVPDWGGVATAIEAEEKTAGLRFNVWDSGSLADTLERVVSDPELWRSLHEAGPTVADYYSVPRLADRVLRHLGLDRADATTHQTAETTNPASAANA